MSDGDLDLSRVRNAVRGTAESMRRFDSNWQRMQREMKQAIEDGATDAELTATVNEALRGDPDLQTRMKDLIDRLRANASGASPPS